MVKLDNFSNKDLMVTSCIAECGFANKARRTVVKQWNIARPSGEVKIGKFVYSPTGETARVYFLILSQDMHCKKVCSDKCVKA